MTPAEGDATMELTLLQWGRPFHGRMTSGQRYRGWRDTRFNGAGRFTAG